MRTSTTTTASTLTKMSEARERDMTKRTPKSKRVESPSTLYCSPAFRQHVAKPLIDACRLEVGRVEDPLVDLEIVVDILLAEQNRNPDPQGSEIYLANRISEHVAEVRQRLDAALSFGKREG
jgi:hypothetical protein